MSLRSACFLMALVIFGASCGDEASEKDVGDGQTDSGVVDGLGVDGPLLDGQPADMPESDAPRADTTVHDVSSVDTAAVDVVALDAPPPDEATPDVQATDTATPDASTTDTQNPDGPVTDAGVMLPGCASQCSEGQVCDNNVCVAVGPNKACGSATYPADLPANEGIFYVNGSYTGSASNGTQGQPYKSIAAALNAIPAGTKYTIAVAQGEYDESLTIGLRQGSSGVQEEYAADLHCLCPDLVKITQPITFMHVSQRLEVTIDGCTISPAGFDPETATDWATCLPASHGIVALGGYVDFHLRVKDSVIGGWCTGIYYSAEPSPMLDSSLCVTHSRLFANIRGVEVKNAPATQLASPFAECQGANENLALTHSRLDHNKDYGIYTYDLARGIAVTANVIEKTGEVGVNKTGQGYGIYLGDTDSATLSSNVIRDNQNRGVGMRNDKATVPFGIKLMDNLVSNNRGAGIALQQMQAVTALSITGNLVLATKTLQGTPGGDGIQMSADGAPSYNVNISDNTVDGSARNGIFYDGLGGMVDNNTISNNATYGCLLQQSTTTMGTNVFVGNGAQDVHSVSSPIDLYGSLPVPLP